MIKNTIDKMLDLTLVDVDAIRARKFHICVETVNPSDSIALAELFRALNVDFLMLQDDRYGICNRTKKDRYCQCNPNFVFQWKFHACVHKN